MSRFASSGRQSATLESLPRGSFRRLSALQLGDCTPEPAVTCEAAATSHPNERGGAPTIVMGINALLCTIAHAWIKGDLNNQDEFDVQSFIIVLQY